MASFRVATDGYRAESGVAGWAFVVHGGGTHHVRRGRLEQAPSHLAEWVAAQAALAWADAHLGAGDDVELRVDSALVAKGLASRRPAMTGEAAELRAACRQVLARLGERGVRVKVLRVDRRANAEADAEARRAAVG